MIWGWSSWSGLGTASQQSSWMYWMTRLSLQFVFFFPDGSGIFQNNNAKIHRALVVKEWSMRTHEDTWVSGSMMSHFHTWISHYIVLTLTPLKVFGVKGKDWKNGLTLDGNKCWFVGSCRNNTTANALNNQSKSWSFTKVCNLQCIMY